MGYQVGRICYKTAEEATNIVMTQVVPTIDKDGVLHHPVFNGTTWVYKGQTVQLNFPRCEFGEYAKAGKEMGQTMALIIVSVLVIVIVVEMVKTLRERNEE